MISVLEKVKSIVLLSLEKKQKFNTIYKLIEEYLSLLTEEDFKELVTYFNTFVKLTSVFFCFIAIKYSFKSEFFKSNILEISYLSSFFFLSSAAIYEIINGNLKPLPAFYKRFLRDNCFNFSIVDIKVNGIRFLDIINLTHPKIESKEIKSSYQLIINTNITKYRFI